MNRQSLFLTLHTQIVVLLLWCLLCLQYSIEITFQVTGFSNCNSNKILNHDTTDYRSRSQVWNRQPWQLTTRRNTEYLLVTQQQQQQQQQQHVLCATIRNVSGSNQKLTPLPSGLSPFDKSISKTYDIQSVFRTIACTAIQSAMDSTNNNNNNSGQNKIYEIELPPLLSNGIDMSKNQFDDFDNVQELNANRNWCIQFIPKLLLSLSKTKNKKLDVVWFILPDDKECEIAKNEYMDQRYQPTSTIQFTSIRAAYAATNSKNNNNKNAYKKAWGTTLAETVNKLQGGDGILADSSTLDTLDASNPNRIQLICQPGNGGPVEDWINVEQLYYNTVKNENNNDNNNINNNVPITIIMNGALDKVRDGYYPSMFFPALAKTIPFYQNVCEAILFVKPISDKGLYGWLYRVYPEPWQVILQLPKQQQQSRSSKQSDDDNVVIVVEDIVVLVSNTRPSYNDAVNAMIQEALKQQQQPQRIES
jgi:Domain of unknown function (DUF1995)